jgi:hypothetical protein
MYIKMNMKPDYRTRVAFSAMASLMILSLFAGQGVAAEKGSGMKDIEVRCEKYFKDEESRKKCMRNERRAAMDIYDLSEELKDEGKPLNTSPSSKEYDNAAVQRGKYFGACATLFELHMDRMACYHDGLEKYQERVNARMAGKEPFAE